MERAPSAPFSPSSSAQHREGLVAGGRSAGRARGSSSILPRDGWLHGCRASPGGGTVGAAAAAAAAAGPGTGAGAWAGAAGACCGRHLIPCPILECYSVTYNRVTRAAADVPNASIGHRNKEGRVLGSGLYNPELRDVLIGSRGSLAGGDRSRGSLAATRNPIAVVSWEPRGLERLAIGLKIELPQGSWHF
nr:protein SMAX1-like [Chlorocebus sabaeus]